MGWTCSSHEGKKKYIQNFGGLLKSGHLEHRHAGRCNAENIIKIDFRKSVVKMGDRSELNLTGDFSGYY
jgi:hypothetical protein